MKNIKHVIERVSDNGETDDAAYENFSIWTHKEGLTNRGFKLGKLIETEVFSVFREKVRFFGDNIGTYLNIQMAEEVKGSAAVLVFFQDKILLLNHYRFPIGKFVIETPRGFGKNGESSYDVVRRELVEEINAEIEYISHLGKIYPNTGIMDEEVDIFIAKIKSFSVGTENSIKSIVLYTPEELKIEIASNLIQDPFLLSAYTMATANGSFSRIIQGQ